MDLHEAISKRYFELKSQTGDPHLNLREKDALYKKAKREVESEYRKYQRLGEQFK